MPRLVWLSAFVVLLNASPALAQGAAAGAQKVKALGCIACHGRDGVSKLPEAPNLAGQVEVYLKGALAAYRSGARKNELMNTVAEKLTDADIADLASYYAGIEIAVTPPPKP
jgi:cytochrome c553